MLEIRWRSNMSSLDEYPTSPTCDVEQISPTTTTTTTYSTHPTADTTPIFLRASSAKDLSFSQPLAFSPPSLGYQSPAFHRSIPPSPISSSNSIIKCISSVLKKDGQILSMATSNGIVYTGSESNVIRAWKLPEFIECDRLKTRTCRVVALVVTRDKVFGAYGDGKIRIWQRSWDKSVRHVRLATIPKLFESFLPTYISGSRDKLMRHMGPITALTVNISEAIFYSSSLDKTVKVWQISDFKCIETIQAHSEPVNAILASDDGVLFTASDDASIKLWRPYFSTRHGPHSLTVTLPAKNSPVRTITLTSNGVVLYGGCMDGYIHYWIRGRSVGQFEYGGALQGHTNAVLCLASVGDYVISGSADWCCRVWVREEDGQHICRAIFGGHRGPIRCVQALPMYGHEVDSVGLGVGSSGRSGHDGSTGRDGCMICTGSLDGVIKVWRVTC